MTRIFCITNQKGGVGKTTTAVNLAAGLSRLGKRVLLIDLDPQGNATTSSGIDKKELGFSIYPVLLGLCDAKDARQTSTNDNYDILPANRDLAGAEVELMKFDQREYRLKKALEEIAAEYDFVLIDCPPSLSLLTVNALCATNGLIIPMQCEYFALEGLTDLLNAVKRIHATSLNPNLRIIGMIRVMFNRQVKLSQQVSEQLQRHFSRQLFQTIIPRNVRLAEAPSHRMSCIAYDFTSTGSQAYMDFSREMLGWLAEPRTA